MGKYEQGNIDVLFTITLLCDDRVIPLLLQQVPSFYKYYMDEGCAWNASDKENKGRKALDTLKSVRHKI